MPTEGSESGQPVTCRHRLVGEPHGMAWRRVASGLRETFVAINFTDQSGPVIQFVTSVSDILGVADGPASRHQPRDQPRYYGSRRFSTCSGGGWCDIGEVREGAECNPPTDRWS